MYCACGCKIEAIGGGGACPFLSLKGGEALSLSAD